MDAPPEIAFGSLLFGGIGFMLLAAVLLVLFVVVYQRRLLAQQRHLRTTEAAYQRQLLAAIIEAQEGERERIGRDLHDGIGSTIATAKLLVNRLDGATNPDTAGMLQLVKDIIAGAVQDVRSVSHNLYPVVLARFGLAEALQHLVDVGNEASPVAVTLDLHYPRPLARPQELALYRICQELLHNGLRHAQGATRLAVALYQQGPLLVLSVEDDGCGFAPAPADALGPGAGAGLRSIEVRVQLLQARLQRRTAPGQGTHTRIELDHAG